MGSLLSMLSNAPTAPVAIVRLPFIPDLDIQEERKPPTLCASAIALYNIPFDTETSDAILASGCLLSVVFFMGTYVQFKRRSIPLTECVHKDGTL